MVGAGYSVSATAGDLGTFVKLLRVAMLVPVVIVLGLLFRDGGQRPAGGGQWWPVPWFLTAFVILFALNSGAMLPVAVTAPVADLAPSLLLLAIAALGIRTSMQEVMTIGLKPVLLIVGETLFIAGLVGAFLLLR